MYLYKKKTTQKTIHCALCQISSESLSSCLKSVYWRYSYTAQRCPHYQTLRSTQVMNLRHCFFAATHFSYSFQLQTDYYTVVTTSTLSLCPSRRRLHSPSCPASSAAGCDCGRKTWWLSSLCDCSPAEGRVLDSARSRLWRALATPPGSSSGASPQQFAQPRTKAASAHHACLQDAEGGAVTDHLASGSGFWRILNVPDFGGTHLLLCVLDAGGLTGRGVVAGGLFFRGGRPGPFFFFTTTSVFSFTSSFSSSASESSEKESAELPDMTAR